MNHGNRPELTTILDRFEKAWSNGTVPEISKFLPNDEPRLVISRDQVLAELVMVDLERRWRSESSDADTLQPWEDLLPGKPLLEDYARCYGVLELPKKLVLELISWEYQVRQRWGDCPSQEEYSARFPKYGDPIRDRLANVDAQFKEMSDDDRTNLVSVQQTDPGPVIGDSDNTNLIEGIGSVETNGRGKRHPTSPAVSFGDYELIEEIARGGMGVVYKARQRRANRIVALKMILSGRLAGREEVSRFFTEAEAAAKLDHPGIVPIFDVGEVDGQHYYSMGFVDGETLADRIHDGPIDTKEACEITAKIADAVQYAHECGVIHRDLKPANVLLDKKKKPKVTDFGLAKQVESEGFTQTGVAMGTPSYMPPEQAAGELRNVGPQSDVYSLGAILYCLVTGRPPFQSATQMDILRQVLENEPIAPQDLNPGIPKDINTICLKSLQKDPHRRYLSAGDFRDELRRYLRGEPILARPIGRIQRGWRWCRRKPTLAALLVISLVLLVVSTIGAIVVAEQQKKLAQAALDDGRKSKAAASREKGLREIAEAEEVRAERSAEIAEANFGLAIQAVDRMLSRLGQDDNAYRDPIQRELLNDALDFYRQLLESENRNAPSIRFRIGKTQSAIGESHELLGDVQQAEAAYRSAIEIFSDLCRKFPDVVAYKDNEGQVKLIHDRNFGSF